MSVFVVDASVAIKWFVPEVQSEAAAAWLAAAHDYVAPDLILVEAGNVLWKKVRRGELTADVAQRLIDDMMAMAVETVPARALMPDAFSVAAATGLTVYDALYVALAARLETAVVTADERLVRAARSYEVLGRYVRSVTELP